TPSLTTTTTYWVRVSNVAGSVNSTAATITVTVATVAPSITQNPQSQTINPGATATMTVTATGTPSPTYQWYQGASGDAASAIVGAASSTYTTPALVATTSYWVRVTNAGGSADSTTAVIS